MRTKRVWNLCAAVALVAVAACGRTTSPSASETTAQPTYVPEATIKDLMLGLIDTSADTFWLSVTTTVDDRGVVEVRPQNDEEWMNVRYGALRLAEAANLLKIPGRRVALPGEKSIAPGIELEPEEMQVMIAQDPAEWNARATAFHDAAMLAVAAAEAKDPQRVIDAGETLEHACEGCHRQFWYPNEKIPELPSAP